MAVSKTTKPNKAPRSDTRLSQRSHRGQSHTGQREQKPAEDGLKLLQARTKALKTLSSRVLAAEKDERVASVRDLIRAWLVHHAIGERIVLPALGEAGVESTILQEFEIECDLANLLLADLRDRSPEDEVFQSMTTVFCKLVPRLLALEDRKGTGLIAKARKAGVDTLSLGSALQDALAQEYPDAEERLRHPMPRHLRGVGYISQEKKYEVMRGNDRERDDQGRFMRDDDASHGGGGRGNRRSMSQSSGGGGRHDDHDDRRGWHGDARGHSEASRRGWDDRRSQGSSRSGGRYDDDHDDDRSYSSRGRSQSGARGDRRSGGWFGDREGHSEASRRGWQNSDHGDSGWYGDREGHSEASRRGWQNPDHGDSGWFGDRDGHSQAAQRGWRNPDHGESGWFGDSEGHAEASRRGWESRCGSRRSIRDDDDDDRRARGAAVGATDATI